MSVNEAGYPPLFVAEKVSAAPTIVRWLAKQTRRCASALAALVTGITIAATMPPTAQQLRSRRPATASAMTRPVFDVRGAAVTEPGRAGGAGGGLGTSWTFKICETS